MTSDREGFIAPINVERRLMKFVLFVLFVQQLVAVAASDVASSPNDNGSATKRRDPRALWKQARAERASLMGKPNHHQPRETEDSSKAALKQRNEQKKQDAIFHNLMMKQDTSHAGRDPPSQRFTSQREHGSDISRNNKKPSRQRMNAANSRGPTTRESGEGHNQKTSPQELKMQLKLKGKRDQRPTDGELKENKATDPRKAREVDELAAERPIKSSVHQDHRKLKIKENETGPGKEKSSNMVSILMQLTFEDRQWKVPETQWRVVSDVAIARNEKKTLVSSKSAPSQISKINPFQVLSKFMVAPNTNYSLILDGLQDNEEDTSVSVTLLQGGSILATGNSISLNGNAHSISFAPTRYASTRINRRLEDKKEDSVPENERDPPAPTAPLAPKPPDTGGGGNNGAGNGAANGAGNGAANGTGNGGGIQPDATPVPAVFDGTRPPVVGVDTPQPSVSSMPSGLPTIEPSCISTTNGTVEFSSYIAARFRLTNEGVVPDNAIQTIVSDLQGAYNNVATCRQKGAFRTVDQAVFVEVYEEGSTSTEIELIVRLPGFCEGCSEPVNLFSGVRESPQPIPDENSVRHLAAGPCFCPAPTRLAFLDEFNRLQGVAQQRQASSIDIILDVVELEDAYSCVAETAAQNAQDILPTPDVHTALVSVVLSRDPDEMNPDDLDQVLKGFRDIFHSQQGLTYGTCDLSRKEIINVEVDPENRESGRQLRGAETSTYTDRWTETKATKQRHLQQTTADFELLVEVSFRCFGCDGRLFGETNYTASPGDCLCPIEPEQKGVQTNVMLLPWNEAINASLIEQSVSDVIEVEAIECSPSFDIFSAVVVIEYSLPNNSTTPTDTDIEALESEYINDGCTC
jgi:hypothetical protein